MSSFHLLVNLCGFVALLVWGVRMVRKGVTRSFTAQMRGLLGAASGNRVMALMVGFAVTVVLQSSTATGLILSSFVARALMGLSAALSAMLGADMGTAVAAFIFSIDVSWLPPALIAAGVALFLSNSTERARSLSRIAIGLGLTLLSLQLIKGTSVELREARGLEELLSVLSGQPVVLVLIGAVVTWLAHSSLSIVILVMSLVGSSVIAPSVALPLVLGANLGGSVAPYVDQLGAPPVARRVLLGNLLMRGTMVLAFLALLLPLSSDLVARFAPSAPQGVLIFHLAFNMMVALVFLPLVGIVERVVRRLVPDVAGADTPGTPRYLDSDVIDSPAEAIACATRETLALGDLVVGMLRDSMTVIEHDDGRLLKQIERRDDEVDNLYEAIKLYLMKVSQSEMTAAESRRYVEVLTFVTNLEHIGDIIDKNLLELAAKKIRRRYAFSREGIDELRAFHGRVVENLKLSLNVLTTNDLTLARRLLAEKPLIRDIEQEAAESHFERLRAGRPESVETSAIHLDIVRDLKRINSHLTSVAYPILEAAGELLESRLRKERAAPLAATPAIGGNT
ncbi:MAG: Na/Pi cotransporter family protein [Hyphomicrobiaceae bacterium]